MQQTTRRQLAGGLAIIVIGSGLAWLALGAPGPDWLRWALGTLVVLAVSAVAMAVLLGPVARWMAGEPRALSARDRKRLTAKDRIEAVNNARATLLQATTGLVVVGGLLFTGAGLIYTSRTLDATREGQITDRYTKAVEQLGSSKIDVRLGGIYALQRLAADSPRDKGTIIEVLIAYVRVHAQPVKSERVEGQAMADVAAALNVIGRLVPTPGDYAFNLAQADLHGLSLSGANLVGVNLRDADLPGTDLRDADLRNANLSGADLIDANLIGTDLRNAILAGAYLRGADLRKAILRPADLGSVDLTGADLRGADLTSAALDGADLSGANLTYANLTYVNLIDAKLDNADLYGADLTDANLTDADLRNADLTGANLTGTDLRGTDLRGVKGMTPARIKEQATTDAETTFG